jgi:hypothetical protein
MRLAASDLAYWLVTRHDHRTVPALLVTWDLGDHRKTGRHLRLWTADLTRRAGADASDDLAALTPHRERMVLADPSPAVAARAARVRAWICHTSASRGSDDEGIAGWRMFRHFRGQPGRAKTIAAHALPS